MNPRSVIGKSSVLAACVMACGLLGACERHTDVYSYDPKVDSVAPPQLAVNTASYLEDQKLRARPTLAEPPKATTPTSAPAARGGAGAAPEAATTTPAAAAGGATTAPAVPTAPKTTPPPPIPE